MKKRSDIDTTQSTKTAISSSQKVQTNQNGVQNPQNDANLNIPPSVADRTPGDENDKNTSEELKKLIDFIWQKMIEFLLWLAGICQIICEYVVDICVKIYRIALFCYRKPEVAKDLLYTTFHLLKVSYDAEIWSWTELFAVLKSHLIQPMTKNPPPPPTAAKPPPPKENKKVL